MTIAEIVAIGNVFVFLKHTKKVVVRFTESQLLIKDGVRHIPHIKIKKIKKIKKIIKINKD